MRRMYQSKMYQVNGTSALASYKPAFKVIEGGAKKGSVAPQLEEVSYVKTLTNKEAFYCRSYCYRIIYSDVCDFFPSYNCS